MMTATERSVPPPQAGAKAPAPGVPITKGSDNSIQTWGLEASAVERAQVAELVRDFHAARAEGDWQTVCERLAAEQRRMAEALTGKANCAAAMARLAAGTPARAFAEEARIEKILSLRIGGGNAFLIYTRREGEVYATALGREEGAWKVISVGPTPLGAATVIGLSSTAPSNTSADG